MEQVLVEEQSVIFYRWSCPYCGLLVGDNSAEKNSIDNPSKIECGSCGKIYEVYFGEAS